MLENSTMQFRFAFKIHDMEKLYEEVCSIFTADYGRKRRMEELAQLYQRIGSASVTLDNMLYERLGLSCEDLIEMLRKGQSKIN